MDACARVWTRALFSPVGKCAGRCERARGGASDCGRNSHSQQERGCRRLRAPGRQAPCPGRGAGGRRRGGGREPDWLPLPNTEAVGSVSASLGQRGGRVRQSRAFPGSERWPLRLCTCGRGDLTLPWVHVFIRRQDSRGSRGPGRQAQLPGPYPCHSSGHVATSVAAGLRVGCSSVFHSVISGAGLLEGTRSSGSGGPMSLWPGSFPRGAWREPR